MNFIFINPDEMRADSLGCYGHPVVNTPNLDRLAQEGVRFDQCHTTHTVCSPSRCSFLTGWYPHVRGHRSLWHLLEPQEPNLFKYLSDNGYDIIWYGKNDAFAPETFEGVVDQTLSDVITEADKEKIKKGYQDSGNPFDPDDPMFYSFLYKEMNKYEETRDYVCVEKAVDYIKSDPENPFMLFLPTSMPHCPYHAPQGFHDMYNPEDMEVSPVPEKNQPKFHKKIRETRNLDQISEDQFKNIKAKYLGMVSYVDSIFGELLQALEETGLEEETAIFVFSDHGDWAGDYGLVEKWPSGMDDSLTRVPLIAKVPGAKEGHQVQELVELHDITPTVLELAGIKPQHSMFAESLVPQLKGEPGDPTRAVFTEGGYDLPQDEFCFEGRSDVHSSLLEEEHIYYPKVILQQEHPETVCRSTSIRTQDYKLIMRSKQINELYDLNQDPQELNNVYQDPDYGEIKNKLEKRMLKWYLETSDAPAWNNYPRGFSDEEGLH